MPSGPCWATLGDGWEVTGGQGVAGSNPAVPTQRTSPLITVKAEVSGHFRVKQPHALSPSINRSRGPFGDH
jgi:hypothetical protein